MALRAGVQHVSIAIFSVLALASVADAQTSSVGGAEKLSYGVDAGIGETDNVTLASTNKVSQTIATVGVDFDINHQSRRLDVDAKGYFSDYAYLEGAYGNQLLGRFDGTAHLALIPQRLTWVLQDDYGQATLDPFAPGTPRNLESVNYVSTGPDLALRFGGTGFGDASVRLARATFQTSPFNSTRVLGSLTAGLQLSARSSVSLNGVAERVLFENTAVNGDFDRTSAYVRYEIQGARTGLSADLGATKISQNGSSSTSPVFLVQNGIVVAIPVTVSQNAYSTTGPLARISVSRKLSSAATLSLSAGRELIDGTSSFTSVQGGAIGVVGTVSALLTSSSFTTKFASAAWAYERNRTKIAVSARWERDVYVTERQFDLTRGGVEFNVERKLSRAFALQVLGRYGKSNYPNATLLTLQGGSPKFDEGLIAASLSWRYSRAIEARLRVEHSSRTTTGVDQGYRENRIFVTIGYRPRSQLSDDKFSPMESPRPTESPLDR